MEQSRDREIRVFLSSTFRDMEVERNYLLKQVFPKVRAACLARQVGFTEIDLRWGVTEEESKNGATVEICLKEIDRCRDFPPFFIGFLGERYGWIPMHEDLAAYWTRHADSDYGKQILQAVQRGISVTELEMELGVLGNNNYSASMPRADLTDHALFCLRSPEFSQTLYTQARQVIPPATEADFFDPADGRLEALKVRIRKSGLLGLGNYISIEHFGASIETHLLTALDRYFPEDEIPTAQQLTDAAHAAFRYHRLLNFLPRPDVRDALLARMTEHVEYPSLGPILLGGPSGQGKSTLMADLARYLNTTDTLTSPHGIIRYRVIDHYIGADDSTNLDAWILRLLDILHPEIDQLTGPIPEATKDRREALSTWFTYAARQGERQVLEQEGASVRICFALLLDAVDQLPDRGADLDLLKPNTLGPDVILVASAADNTPASQHEYFQTTVSVPPLDDALRATLISDTLKRFRKSLPNADAKRLAQAHQAGSPLFLGLALEVLRVNAHHETLDDLVTDILRAPNAAQLFLNNFLLDPDYARPNQPDLAVRFIALLEASRAGLTEIELADLLALPDDPEAEDTNAPRLPQKFLSNLLANFGPFLLNKEGRRAPMHRILGEVALDHLSEETIREQLYHHFRPGYEIVSARFDIRWAAETLHQITCLARNSAVNKVRLENDIANQFISSLTLLYKYEDDAEAIIVEALNLFSFEEKSVLAQGWGKFVGGIQDAVTGVDGHQFVEIAESYEGFAMWLRDRIGHLPTARSILASLLNLYRRILGGENTETLRVMGNYALILGDLDDPAALDIEKELLAARQRVLGNEHTDTLTAMANLAYSYHERGDYLFAKEFGEQVLPLRIQISGEDDYKTLAVMSVLSSTLAELGEFTEAIALGEKVHSIRRRVFGDLTSIRQAAWPHWVIT